MVLFVAFLIYNTKAWHPKWDRYLVTTSYPSDNTLYIIVSATRIIEKLETASHMCHVPRLLAKQSQGAAGKVVQTPPLA